MQFDATDGAELAGLLYEPRRPRGVVVFLHGTGGASVFDSRRTNLLAAAMLERRLAFFAFNNRGSDIIRKIRGAQFELGGMAYERIRECVDDISGVVRMLRARGYRDITLVGHSTGANKIAVYDYYVKRNQVTRYVFFAGGDDVGLWYERLGPRRFASVLGHARKKRNSGEIASHVPTDYPQSWRALYDMMNPDGDYNVFPFLEAMGRVKLSRRPLFRHLKGIRRPSLYIYGDRDEYSFNDVSGCVSAMANALGGSPNHEFVIVRDADHGFGGKVPELGALIADWVLG